MIHTPEDDWLAECEFAELHRDRIDRLLGVSNVGTLPRQEPSQSPPPWPVAKRNKTVCGCRVGFTCRRHRLEMIEVRKAMQAMEVTRER